MFKKVIENKLLSFIGAQAIRLCHIFKFVLFVFLETHS